MSNNRLRNVGLGLIAGSMLTFAGAGEAAAPDLAQIYQPNQISVTQVSSNNFSNSNVNNSSLNLENIAKLYVTKDTFSFIPNMQKAAEVAAGIEKKFGLEEGSVLKAMNDYNRKISASRDKLINERFVSHNELDDLNGPKKVYFPVMRKYNAKNQDELSAVCWDPNALGRVNYVKNDQPNQSYGAFCVQKYYQDHGLDPLTLVMSSNKAKEFHDKYGDLNQVNALMVPFYSSRADMRMELPVRDSSFDFRMNGAINNRLSFDGFAAYDRGTDNKKGYKLNSEQVEMIAYEYGLDTVEELQHTKTHFFTNDANQLIDKMFKESNSIYGTSYSMAEPVVRSSNVAQMSTADLSKAQEILRDNEIQNSNANSLGTVKVGDKEYSLSDGLYRGGSVKLGYDINGAAGFVSKDGSDRPMVMDDLGRSVPLSKDDVERLKGLTQKFGNEVSQALGRGSDMSDFKVQYGEAERNSFKNFSATAMSNQNSVVMEPKVMHLEGLRNDVNPNFTPQQTENLIIRKALAQTEDTLKASGKNYNLSMDFSSVSNIKYNSADKTYSCDVAYSAEKQQENIKSADRQSGQSLANQGTVIETKTISLNGLCPDLKDRIDGPGNRSQVVRAAGMEAIRQMQANGELNPGQKLRPGTDYSVGNISRNDDGTYKCDVVFRLPKQQENSVQQGVKATAMSTESLGKVQTDGTVKIGDLGISLPPPVMEPKVMHLEGLKNDLQPDLAPREAGELMTRKALAQAEDTLKASGKNYNLSMDYSSVSNMKYNPVDKTFSCDVAYSAEKQQENIKSADRSNEGLGKVQTEGCVSPEMGTVQTPVMEQKVMHLEGLKGNPNLSAENPGADSFVKIQAIAKTELELRNSGLKYNFDRNPNSVGNIKYNPENKTYSCDVVYNVEKQQENVKAAGMSTASLNQVQTEGKVQPPPPDRPMVMDDTGKMHAMTNDELNVVRNAAINQQESNSQSVAGTAVKSGIEVQPMSNEQKSEKEHYSVSSSGCSHFVSVDDDKRIGFEQTDYYVKCNNANEAADIAKAAYKEELSRSDRLNDDSSFKALGKPEFTENGYKITVEARNVKEDSLENSKSAEFSADRDGNSKPNFILRGKENQELTQENTSKSAENDSKEKPKEKANSRDRGNCLE